MACCLFGRSLYWYAVLKRLSTPSLISVFVLDHTDYTITGIVKKSVSSRKLRQELSEDLDKIYWKDFVWNGFYFVASCGDVTISTLRKYKALVTTEGY